MKPFEWTDIDGRIGHVLVLPATRDTSSRLRISLFDDVGDYGRVNCIDSSTGRQIAAAIVAACDELDPPKVEPVRIERWLTPEDVEKHGNRWRWYSEGWDGGHEDCTVFVSDDRVSIVIDDPNPDNHPASAEYHHPGDCFTPISRTERSSG